MIGQYDRAEVAHHESAHLVAAKLLGGEPLRADLVRQNNGRNGEATYLPPETPARQIAVMLAGPQATRRYFGIACPGDGRFVEGIEHFHGASDLISVDAALAEIYGPGFHRDSRPEFIQACQLSRGIVLAYWTPICHAAKWLSAKGTIRGELIEAILKRHEANNATTKQTCAA